MSFEMNEIRKSVPLDRRRSSEDHVKTNNEKWSTTFKNVWQPGHDSNFTFLRLFIISCLLLSLLFFSIFGWNQSIKLLDGEVPRFNSQSSLTTTDQEIIMHLANSDIAELQKIREEFLSTQSKTKALKTAVSSTLPPVAAVLNPETYEDDELTDDERIELQRIKQELLQLDENAPQAVLQTFTTSYPEKIWKPPKLGGITRESSEKIKILIGVFTMARDYERRDAVRQLYKKENLSHIKIRFVLGNNQITKRTLEEMKMYDDFLVLDIVENMNDGKTHKFFHHVWHHSSEPVDIVFKSDLDAHVCLQALGDQLKKREKDILNGYFYYGKYVDHRRCRHPAICPPKHCRDFQKDCWVYAQGGFYGINWNLLAQMMRLAEKQEKRLEKVTEGKEKKKAMKLLLSGHEDLQMGKWIKATGKDVKMYPKILKGKYWWEQPFCHSKMTFHQLDEEKVSPCAFVSQCVAEKWTT